MTDTSGISNKKIFENLKKKFLKNFQKIFKNFSKFIIPNYISRLPESIAIVEFLTIFHFGLRNISPKHPLPRVHSPNKK